jgi:hypothetical protein
MTAGVAIFLRSLFFPNDNTLMDGKPIASTSCLKEMKYLKGLDLVDLYFCLHGEVHQDQVDSHPFTFGRAASTVALSCRVRHLRRFTIMLTMMLCCARAASSRHCPDALVRSSRCPSPHRLGTSSTELDLSICSWSRRHLHMDTNMSLLFLFPESRGSQEVFPTHSIVRALRRPKTRST